MVQKNIDKKDSSEKDLHTPASDVSKRRRPKIKPSLPLSEEEYPFVGEESPRPRKSDRYFRDDD